MAAGLDGNKTNHINIYLRNIASSPPPDSHSVWLFFARVDSGVLTSQGNVA